MTYASVARGYKGPGFNVGFAIGLPTVAPEYTTDVEVGIKGSYFDKHLLFNFSAFNETVKGFQAQSFDVALTSYVIANAGELKSRGFEMGATGLLAQGLKASLGLSYVDAYFASFAGDQCYVGQPASSCYVQPGASGPTSNSTGNALPNAPRWSGTLSLEYRGHLTGQLDGKAALSEYARSRVNFSSNADPHTLQPGYGLTDASLALASGEDTWALTVFCRNCLDRRFVTYIEANPLVPTSYGQQFGINSFRTIGVSVEVRR